MPSHKRGKGRGGSKPSKRRRIESEFLDTEAREETSPGEPSQPQGTSDDPEEDGSGDESFIDDTSQRSHDTVGEHLAADSVMRQAEDSIAASSAGDVLSSIASRLRSRRGEAQVHPEEPYFPLGLAISHLSPMEFNFDLFLYDTLKLPHGLFQDDSNAEKTFETLEECQEYCQRFIQEAERRRTRIQAPEGDRSHEARRSLSKTAMFNNIGTSLTDIMTTGNVAFDAHLADLKLDMFGNVMFIRAPSWSDLAVQFTHGYPRRLITASHAGILPGNLTVAAKISNQAIRSLSTVINDDCQLSPNSK